MLKLFEMFATSAKKGDNYFLPFGPLTFAGTSKPDHDFARVGFLLYVVDFFHSEGYLGDDSFEVLSTSGDTHLGGDDFDQAVIDWLADEFNKEQGIDLRSDVMALQRLKEAAEKAKCELSSIKEAEINLPFIVSTGRNEALHLQTTISRDKLGELCGDLLDRTLEICSRTLDDAELTALYNADEQPGWSTYVEIEPWTSYEAAQVSACKGPGE